MGRRSHSTESAWGPEHAERIRQDLHESWRWLRRTCETLLEELESLNGPVCGEHHARRARLAKAKPRLETTRDAGEYAVRTLPNLPLTWIERSAVPVLTGAGESYDAGDLWDILECVERNEAGLVLFETSAGRHRLDDTITGRVLDVSIDGLYWHHVDVIFQELPDKKLDGMVIHILTRDRGLRRDHASTRRRPSVVEAEVDVMLLAPIGIAPKVDSVPVRLVAALHDEVGIDESVPLHLEVLDEQTRTVFAA